ncbi:MAG: hypothetical protein RIF41_11810 [Polyangiaceae bacterium]
MSAIDDDAVVADALEAYLARHGLDRAGYAADDFRVGLGPLTLVFPNPGYLEVHHLHHLVHDAAPNFWGEVQVSALELRSGPPTFLIGLLCVGALVFGFLLNPRRTLGWWRAYRGCRNLYGEKPEDLRPLQLAALFERMGVARPRDDG